MLALNQESVASEHARITGLHNFSAVLLTICNRSLHYVTVKLLGDKPVTENIGHTSIFVE